MELHPQRLIQNLSILRFKQYKLSQKELTRKFIQRRQRKNLLTKTKLLLKSSLIIIHQKTNTKIATIHQTRVTHITIKLKVTIKSMTMASMVIHTEQNYCQKTAKSARHQQYSLL